MSDMQDQVKAMKEKLANRAKITESNMAGAVTKACLRVEREAKLLMKNTITMAPITGSGKWHYPAAPGEPPAIDTGRLVGSITHSVDGNVGRVGTNVDYGRDLEYGTSKTFPHPWLKVALDHMSDTIRQDFKKVLSQGQVDTSDA